MRFVQHVLPVAALLLFMGALGPSYFLAALRDATLRTSLSVSVGRCPVRWP